MSTTTASCDFCGEQIDVKHERTLYGVVLCRTCVRDAPMAELIELLSKYRRAFLAGQV